MDEATRTRAFEPFFTTKETGKGSGLGLSMVYGFIKQSNGHINIYSEPGLGTTVKLYLPRAPDEARVEAEEREPDASPRGSELILVVEDDDLVREFVSELIGSLGYHTICARNGQDALTALKSSPDIELLFTDIVMPGGLNGRQLADMARVTRPDLPVLFTSGYTEEAMVHHGRLDHGVLLLSKPYRRRDLALKLRQALDGKPTKAP
jgi:CheY-like chemotaxis protein